MNENSNNYIYLDLTSQKHPSDFLITAMQLTRGQLSVGVEVQHSPWVAQGERRGLVLDLDAALTVSLDTHDEPVQTSRKMSQRKSFLSWILDSGLLVSIIMQGTETQSSPVLSLRLAQSASRDRVTPELLLCFSLCYFLFATTHTLPELSAA